MNNLYKNKVKALQHEMMDRDERARQSASAVGEEENRLQNLIDENVQLKGALAAYVSMQVRYQLSCFFAQQATTESLGLKSFIPRVFLKNDTSAMSSCLQIDRLVFKSRLIQAYVEQVYNVHLTETDRISDQGTAVSAETFSAEHPGVHIPVARRGGTVESDYLFAWRLLRLIHTVEFGALCLRRLVQSCNSDDFYLRFPAALASALGDMEGRVTAVLDLARKQELNDSFVLSFPELQRGISHFRKAIVAAVSALAKDVDGWRQVSDGQEATQAPYIYECGMESAHSVGTALRAIEVEHRKQEKAVRGHQRDTKASAVNGVEGEIESDGVEAVEKVSSADGVKTAVQQCVNSCVQVASYLNLLRTPIRGSEDSAATTDSGYESKSAEVVEALVTVSESTSAALKTMEVTWKTMEEAEAEGDEQRPTEDLLDRFEYHLVMTNFIFCALCQSCQSCHFEFFSIYIFVCLLLLSSFSA